MGASGSGKSTLLGLLAGLDNPSSGNVRWQGTAISYLPENELAQLRGRTIGFVFQSYQLIPTLTALENVLLPYELNAEAGSRREGLDRARQLLTAVGLSERLDHYPVQLSGGEQQRVALARAFMLRPPIVLADEPTGISTRRTASTCSISCSSSTARKAQRSCLSRTTPRSPCTPRAGSFCAMERSLPKSAPQS